MTHRRIIHGFWRNASGQDLIEYGLLASVIGIAGVLVWPQIAVVMDDVFTGWGLGVYNLWVPNDPGV